MESPSHNSPLPESLNQISSPPPSPPASGSGSRNTPQTHEVHTDQTGEQAPTALPELEFFSNAPLIEEYGSIEKIWPNNPDNVLPQLKKNQSRETKSTLLPDSISISFDEQPERIRDHSNILPRALYRVHYETSKTLSSQVDKHSHPQHRSTPKLKIQDKNAFQSMGTFNFRRDLTRERIERHLVWAKAEDPSSLISAFNNLSDAERRCRFHSEKSARVGRRAFVAKIKTRGLIAATVKGRLETTITLTTKKTLSLGTITESATKIRDVTMPVWIRESARPANGSTITHKELEKSGADMWMSITELRRSDLQKHTPNLRKHDQVAAKGHHYEWLAFGFIPKSCVVKYMPWDGSKLHKVADTRIIRSIGNSEPWIWDWRINMWRLDARLFRTACFLAVYGGNKRKIAVRNVTGKSNLAAKHRKKAKRPIKTKKTPLDDNPYAISSDKKAETADIDELCCTSCGQKKAAFRLEDETSGPLAFLDLASATKALTPATAQ